MAAVGDGDWLDVAAGLCHALPGHPNPMRLSLMDAMRYYKAAVRLMSPKEE